MKNSPHSSNKCYEPDERGEIKLGGLQSFETLTVQSIRKIAIPLMSKTWNLNVFNRPVYQSNRVLYAVKGETVFLELEPSAEFDPSAHLSLQEFSTFGYTFLQSRSQNLKCHIENQLHVITLNNLEEGQYLFTNHFTKETIKINVVEGYRVAENTLIYATKANTVYENVLKVSALPKVCGVQDCRGGSVNY